MSNHPIDDLFRSKLRQTDSQDLENNWLLVKDQLVEKKKDRLPLWVWWGSGIAASLLLLVLANMYRPSGEIGNVDEVVAVKEQYDNNATQASDISIAHVQEDSQLRGENEIKNQITVVVANDHQIDEITADVAHSNSKKHNGSLTIAEVYSENDNRSKALSSYTTEGSLINSSTESYVFNSSTFQNSLVHEEQNDDVENTSIPSNGNKTVLFSSSHEPRVQQPEVVNPTTGFGLAFLPMLISELPVDVERILSDIDHSSRASELLEGKMVNCCLIKKWSGGLLMGAQSMTEKAYGGIFANYSFVPKWSVQLAPAFQVGHGSDRSAQSIDLFVWDSSVDITVNEESSYQSSSVYLPVRLAYTNHGHRLMAGIGAQKYLAFNLVQSVALTTEELEVAGAPTDLRDDPLYNFGLPQEVARASDLSSFPQLQNWSWYGELSYGYQVMPRLSLFLTGRYRLSDIVAVDGISNVGGQTTTLQFDDRWGVGLQLQYDMF